MTKQSVIEGLRRSTLFSELEDKDLEALANVVNERSFPAGSTLVREGETGATGFWVIVDGTVEVRRGDQVLATLGPGDHVGEMALLSGRETPRSADVVAAEDTRVVQLTRWDLRGLISSHPDIALAMLASLAERLREADRALAGEG